MNEDLVAKRLAESINGVLKSLWTVHGPDEVSFEMVCEEIDIISEKNLGATPFRISSEVHFARAWKYGITEGMWTIGGHSDMKTDFQVEDVMIVRPGADCKDFELRLLQHSIVETAF